MDRSGTATLAPRRRRLRPGEALPAGASGLPLDAFAEHMREAFWISSPDGDSMLYVSARYEELWDLDATSLRHRPALRFTRIHAEDRVRVQRTWNVDLRAGRYDEEFRVVRPDGSYGWLRDRGYPVRDERRRILYVVGMAEDVTERKESELALVAEACRDPLTGLLNRRGLAGELDRERRRAARSHAPVVAALIDCDDFKSVNDRFGHAVGDLVLKEVARHIASSLRRRDHLARVGGDEFVLLLPGTCVDQALRIGNRVRRAVARAEITAANERIPVTVSIGICEVGDESATLDDILHRAGWALRESKRSGKNRIAVAGDDARIR